jgi:hypothetical protein
VMCDECGSQNNYTEITLCNLLDWKRLINTRRSLESQPLQSFNLHTKIEMQLVRSPPTADRFGVYGPCRNKVRILDNKN